MRANLQRSEEYTLAEREPALTWLQQIPNVGPRMAADLVKLVITSLKKAADRNSDEMYHGLCVLEAKRHDPFMRDGHVAAISQAEGHSARPWWEFTTERRRRETTH